MSSKKRLRPQDYTVGWLCALARTEQVAAIKMLDEQHQELPKPLRDYNTYTYGSIGSHNVVIACLPLSHPGTTSASRMANFLPTTFPNMRLHLFVGIGGGIPYNPPDPDASQDIHLGDVVVGVDQTPGVPGVVQYDFIRDQGEGARELLGVFDKPNPELLTALGKLFSNYEMGDSNPQVHLARLTGLRSDFSRPPPGGDQFYQSTYKHVDGASNCDQCSTNELVVRNERQPPKSKLMQQNATEPETLIPMFHQGQILSGNSVLKDAKRRDELSQAYPHARCFEMEAAGVVDQTHCLVIRGIADYADSHKNQAWQPYAAGTAAALARELLLTVQSSVVEQMEVIAPTTVQATNPSFGGQLESGNVHWMVPRSTNTLFTGRTNILEKLGHILRPQNHSSPMSEQQKRFVIVGDGGIGKSEVCLKFANDYRQRFWGIFWIDASSEETAKQAFIDVGKMCGANAESFEQVKIWLANTRHSWLLIIDNADDPKIDYAAFFPSGNEGNIILTTRNPQCPVHQTVGFEDLDHLNLQDVTSLLFKAAGIAELSREDDQNAAEKIVQILGSHTLAIIQAGAYVKQQRCSLEDYPAHFRQQEERLLKYHPEQAQSTYGTVYATFETSATRLKSSQDPSAKDALSLLQMLGFIHYEEIPGLMFSRAREEAITIRENIDRLDDEIFELSELQISRLPISLMKRDDIATDIFPWQWHNALTLLESYSIIKMSGIGENLSISMHPLVHTWTRIRQRLASRKEGWRAAGSVIALSMHRTGYDMFHEKLRLHVGAYLDHPVPEYMAGMTELEICQTHYKICILVYQWRDISKLRILLQKLETFKSWTGASVKSRPLVQILTAQYLMQDGQPKEAVEMLERLVETDRSNYFNAQAILASAYIVSKQHQKAINLLEHIVQIRERNEAPENENLLLSQHELGRAYIKNNQFEKAATLLEPVVEKKKNRMMSTHRSLLSSQLILGIAYLGNEQFETAAEILAQVLEILRTILDAKDPDILGTQYGLARAYMGMGNGHYERAAELLEHVVRMDREMLAPDDPDRLASQYQLARAYMGMKTGHYERAAELLENVVGIHEKTLVPDDPDRLASQYQLARAYMGMGVDHYERAAELLENVVGIEDKSLAPEDPDRLALQRSLEEVHRLVEFEKSAEPTGTSGETV